MIRIDKELIRTVADRAKTSARLRTNHNFHESSADPLNRMLNAMEPGTYVQPHKHENPDKREAFLILQGKILVVSFDNDGKVTDHVILNPETGNFGLEIPPRTFHTLICLQEGSVLYELKDGPYDPANDKIFASWAPKEGDSSCNAYVEQLLQTLSIPL